MAKWDHLVESDLRLRKLAREYAATQSDEAAHALAAEYIRQQGLSMPKAPGKSSVSNLGRNLTEITKADGQMVLVHYKMPVAAFTPGSGYVYTKDGRASSITTQKNIKMWIRDHGGIPENAMQVSAEDIAGLI